jgi:peroxiredoxin
MATPSTFVLDRKGKIRWLHIGKIFYDRPSNKEIIDQLRKLPKG